MGCKKSEQYQYQTEISKLSESEVLDKDCDAVEKKDPGDDQCIGERQFVVKWGEVRLRVGRRSSVWLILSRVIVTVEQDRVFHEVPL